MLDDAKRSVQSASRMSSALDKASERAGVAEKRVAQLEDELAKKSSVLANKVTQIEPARDLKKKIFMCRAEQFKIYGMIFN